MSKKFQLSDCDINEIAFCNVPAVPDATFRVLKSGDTDGKPQFELAVKFAKTDVEKKQAIAFALVPDKFDKQGHALTTNEIEKAAHSYAINMAKKQQKGVGTSKNHVEFAEDSYVVESWVDVDGSIAKSLGIDPIPGAWIVKFQFTNDDVWEKVKKGEFTGVSIGGKGLLTPIDKSSDDIEKGILRRVGETILKAAGIDVMTPTKKAVDFNQLWAEQNFDDYFWNAKVALSDAMWMILYDETITDKAAAVAASIDQFRDKIVAFFNGISKADMQKAIASLDNIRKTLKAEIKKQIEKSGNSDGGTDAMNEEQFNKMMKKLEGFKAEMDGISKRLDDAGVAKADAPADTAKSEPAADPARADTNKSTDPDSPTELMKQFIAKAGELTTGMQEIKERIGKLEKRPDVRKSAPEDDADGKPVKKNLHKGTALSFQS